MPAQLPFLGVGLGYRSELDEEIQRHRPLIDWLEVVSDHYLDRPAEQLAPVHRLRRDVPLVAHGLELSIGTHGELDAGYVESLAAFVSAVEAPWCSDHLCCTRAGGVSLGQLTPLVRDRTTAAEVARKAQQVQDRVGVPFLLENITYYIDLSSPLTEAQFLTEVLEHCACGLLLDLTNLHINAVNHGFGTEEFLDGIPLERVVQIHLAGGESGPSLLLDTHSARVPDEVFELLEYVVPRAPHLKGVMIERDQDYPEDFGEVADDLLRVRRIVGNGGAR
ncbi:DUF692 family multinuclear iron-containing protein [Streptomyces sp. NPDC093595]|uniref:DUF692 domain-containing protein n=1 Tax=Streptomyces sp. NPDC093595 TaxID=3366045 RepID=UPI0038062D72